MANTHSLNDVHRHGLVDQPELVRQLAVDADPLVRKELARRGDVFEYFPDVMVELSNDSEPAVRMQVAMSPYATAEVLNKLMDDEDAEVRRLVARHQKTLPETLHRHVKDRDLEARYAILDHPNVELLTIDLMAKEDEDESIRLAATERLKSKAEEQWR